MQMPKNWIAAAALCLVVGGVGGAALTYKLSQRNVVPSASAAAGQPAAPAQSGAPGAVPLPSQSLEPAGEDIGPEGAKAFALAHAGLDPQAVTGITVESDWEQGRLEYEVEFRDGGTRYDYTIDGATGSVLKCWQESQVAPAAPAAGDVGAEEAKAAALAQAGLDAGGVEGITVEPDTDDGRLEYKVEFWTPRLEYEVTVDGASGRVVEYQSKERAPAPAAPSGGDIGTEGAKAAALAHAGVSAGRAAGLTVERDADDGRLEYEVEFRDGNTEYEYTIDGTTGGVLEYKKEDRTPAAGGNGYIGEEAARQAALAHAGVAEADARQYSCDLHHTGGTPDCYRVQFYCGNSCYQYDIGLYDGAVLHHGCTTYQSPSHHSSHHAGHY